MIRKRAIHSVLSSFSRFFTFLIVLPSSVFRAGVLYDSVRRKNPLSSNLASSLELFFTVSATVSFSHWSFLSFNDNTIRRGTGLFNCLQLKPFGTPGPLQEKGKRACSFHFSVPSIDLFVSFVPFFSFQSPCPACLVLNCLIFWLLLLTFFLWSHKCQYSQVIFFAGTGSGSSDLGLLDLVLPRILS